MLARVLDTYSGEKVWSSDIPLEDWLEGEFACDCLRAALFNPRLSRSCWAGDDCRGNDRFVVIDCVMGEGEDWLPSLHECNEAYSEELLFSNGITLD